MKHFEKQNCDDHVDCLNVYMFALISMDNGGHIEIMWWINWAKKKLRRNNITRKSVESSTTSENRIKANLNITLKDVRMQNYFIHTYGLKLFNNSLENFQMKFFHSYRCVFICIHVWRFLLWLLRKHEKKNHKNANKETFAYFRRLKT